MPTRATDVRMFRRVIAMARAAVGLLLACGPSSPSDSSDESSTGESSVRICDGSPGLRLAARLDSGGMVQNYLTKEIGWSYLYVTGSCEAWVLVFDFADPWRDARTMQLDEATELEIAEALHYGSWPLLAGEYSAGATDGASYSFFDGSNLISCYGPCSEAPDQRRRR